MTNDQTPNPKNLEFGIWNLEIYPPAGGKEVGMIDEKYILGKIF